MLSAREHGDRALREARAPLIDFSVNLNPYGPCDAVLEEAKTADFAAYPDPTARVARQAWAQRLGCDADELVFGHGAAELLWHVARLFLKPGDRCAVFAPTFSEMEVAARAVGAQVRYLRAPAEQHFGHDLKAAAEVVGRCQLAYLCTPNNPTGRYISPVEIVELARLCERTTLVVDQSFLSLSEHASDLEHPAPDNVICVRSLTKDHALAGLRVGYARCRAELARSLEEQRASWPTSAPAQAAATAAAAHQEFVRSSWLCIRDDRERLTQGLQRLGLSPEPSVTGFQLVAVPLPARELTARLRMRHFIAVRDCTSFGLPGHIRLAARPKGDRQRLLRALSQELR